ncbi:MAG: SDR family oxidoreductase [Ignavibacteriae bacterium]|nr:SDR family oxidoreductase [Ignavibacteria bacterium]MBI3363570.1 SDR family oxidoreductase [Ignavibacteriota bacterium]
MAKRQPDIRIHRPVVWVTGASRGIGREIAKQFASIGCHVCVTGRDMPSLNSLAGKMTNDGGVASVFSCDVSNVSSVLGTAERIRKKIGNIDVLINNAGITVFKNFLATTLEEFDDIIDTNLRGQIACIKAVLPHMVRRKKGWIINVLSNAAIKTFEGSAAYTATKAGMLGLGKVLREEMGRHNVKVVNVIPGPTETEMWSRSSRKKFSNRMMSAKSVAEAVLAAYRMPDDVVVDQMVIRPIQGDID